MLVVRITRILIFRISKVAIKKKRCYTRSKCDSAFNIIYVVNIQHCQTFKSLKPH